MILLEVGVLGDAIYTTTAGQAAKLRLPLRCQLAQSILREFAAWGTLRVNFHGCVMPLPVCLLAITLALSRNSFFFSSVRLGSFLRLDCPEAEIPPVGRGALTRFGLMPNRYGNAL
jgi:hypothetical protein